MIKFIGEKLMIFCRTYSFWEDNCILFCLMYLDKKTRSRYSIGKHLKTLKNIYHVDGSAEITALPTTLQEYVDELKGKGLQINGLEFAYFRTKNGLKYPGLVATKHLHANTIMLKVPVSCILSTRNAFFSQIQEIFFNHPQFFSQKFAKNWQDRILLTFLLFQNQKQEKSAWYHLIRNLPKEIDYVIFWEKWELEELDDPLYERSVIKKRQQFEEELVYLQDILKMYPNFFSLSSISFENMRWLSTHITTRCFGELFQFYSMVPFAELFNHENTDVYYSMFYQKTNPHRKHGEYLPQAQINNEQIDQLSSSDRSNNFSDIDDDQFFDFNQFQQTEKDSATTQAQNIQVKKININTIIEIEALKRQIYNLINLNDGISLQYISYLLEKIMEYENCEDWTKQKSLLQQIESMNKKYISLNRGIYMRLNRKINSTFIKQIRQSSSSQQIQQKGSQIEASASIISKKSRKIPTKPEYFKKQWPEDKFNKFYMLCSEKCQFQKHSQVYFCYGRLSNRILMLRYGFCLEHNKYDHLFIRIQLSPRINANFFLQKIIKQVKIKKTVSFKIRKTKICLQLITYFRSLRWTWQRNLNEYFLVTSIDQETQILIQTKNLLITEFKKIKNTLEENEQLLFDKKLNYHEYFAVIYRLERQRILKTQVEMIEYAQEILKKMRNGQLFREIIKKQQSVKKLRYQLMMQCYLKSFESLPALKK